MQCLQVRMSPSLSPSPSPSPNLSPSPSPGPSPNPNPNPLRPTLRFPPQGGGKTTMCASLGLLAQSEGLNCVVASIDDFYRRRAHRGVHRGV